MARRPRQQRTEYLVYPVDKHGDADSVDDAFPRKDAAIARARELVKNSDAAAAVVERVYDTSEYEVVAYFGSYAALREGGWIAAPNRTEPQRRMGEAWEYEGEGWKDGHNPGTAGEGWKGGAE